MKIGSNQPCQEQMQNKPLEYFFCSFLFMETDCFIKIKMIFTSMCPFDIWCCPNHGKWLLNFIPDQGKSEQWAWHYSLMEDHLKGYSILHT